MKLNTFWLAAAALGLAAPLLAQTTPAVTAEAFAAGSQFSGLKLSPDGSKLLALTMQGDEEMLAIAGLTDNSLVFLKPPADGELVGYRWAGNGRILFWMGDSAPIGNQNDQFFTRTFVHDLASGKTDSVGPRVMGANGSDILWVAPDGSRLLMAAQAKPTEYPSVYSVDLNSGSARMVQTPYEGTWDWYADSNGRVRMGVTADQRGWSVKYRGPGGGGYAASPVIPHTDEEVVTFSTIIGDTSQGYALLNRDGFIGVYGYDFATRTVGERLFFRPGIDAGEIILDDETGELIGVGFTADSEQVVWLDRSRDAEAATLERTFRGLTTSVISRSRDRKIALVWVGAPNDPGSYYYYNTETGQLRRLARVAEQVDRAGLAAPRPIEYQSRDGLTIHGYLTLPPGREAKGLPLIVMPHGGPYGVRDTLTYDAEVQFLANRGYAVLQPNYRGSAGYGSAFTDAGAGQWGRKMQDDLDDGMDWVVAQGIADPSRVCLVGGSYGGYAALWGATRNPERYRCAVSFAGVSNLKQQLDYQNDFFWGSADRRSWRDRVRGENQVDLLTLSPISRVADLRVPVMLVHGDEDKRVPLRQSSQYDRALTEAGKPHEYYVYPGAGHGFDKPSDQVSYFTRLEAFLRRHNPPN